MAKSPKEMLEDIPRHVEETVPVDSEEIVVSGADIAFAINILRNLQTVTQSPLQAAKIICLMAVLVAKLEKRPEVSDEDAIASLVGMIQTFAPHMQVL